MKQELKEYADAVEANILASKAEIHAKQAKRLAYHRLMAARSALRSKESEMLEDCENHLTSN